MDQFWAPLVYYLTLFSKSSSSWELSSSETKTLWKPILAIAVIESNQMVFDACLGGLPEHKDVLHGCPKHSVLCTLLLLGGLMLPLLHGMS